MRSNREVRAPLTFESTQAMDIETSKLPAIGAPHNGSRDNGTRAWRESVSSGMRTVEAVVRELAQNDVPVLVLAEPGSGKQAAAARIHALSDRSSAPFRVCHGHEATRDTLA